MATRRKLVAILFADIVDFSRQVSLDESAGLERRREVEGRIRGCAETHGGRVGKSLGDGLMLEFGSAVDAVRCALAVREALVEPVQVRIGVHVGDVVEEEGDLHGHAVNLARRVQEAAPPGAVCVTREVYAQVRPALRLQAEPLPETALREFPEPVEVLEVKPAPELPVPAPDGEVPASAPAHPPAGAGRNTLERWQELALKEAVDDEPALSWLKGIGGALGSAVVGGLLLTAAFWLAKQGIGWQWIVAIWILRITGLLALVNGAVRFIAEIGWLHDDEKPQALDEALLERCRALGKVPDSIGEPISRALTAYSGIHRLGAEKAWEQTKVPVKEQVGQAREQLLALLDRAQQIGKVAATLGRFEGAGEVPAAYQPAAELYERQCAGLAAAAERFEQAEAGLSRALLAISAEGDQAAASDPLREMQATAEALAEARDSLSELPALPASGSASAGNGHRQRGWLARHKEERRRARERHGPE